MVVYGGVTTAGGDYIEEGVVVAAAAGGAAGGGGGVATVMLYSEEEDHRMAVDEDSPSSDCHGRDFFCSTPMQAALQQHASSPLRSPSSPLSRSSPCSFLFSSSSASSGAPQRCSTPFGGAAEAGFPEDTSLCLPLSPPGLDLHAAILEAVALEPKYQPSLSLTTIPTSVHEVSGRMRSGSCHVLRCLKVWYELPSDAFFLAVNTMDRFLTRMRAQPKHLSCIAVSSFHVACEELSRSGCCGAAPTRDSVSSISQSKCTAGDVARMEGIIRAKLELGAAPVLPVTPLTMLRLLHAGHRELLSQHFSRLSLRLPALTPLVHKLEVVVCDTRAANYRAAELALALLRRELLRSNADEAHHHAACLQPLTTLCKVNRESLASCEQVVSMVLDEYDSNGDGVDHGTALYHRQRLVWKLSNRTLRHLRPTDRLRRHRRLPTIIETCRDSCSYVSPAAWSRLAAFPLKRVDDGTTGSLQGAPCLQEIDEGSDSSGATEQMDCYSEAATESDSSDSDDEDGEHECISSSVEGDGPANDSGVCVDGEDALGETRDGEESREEQMETSDAEDAGLALSETEESDEQEDGLNCGDRNAGLAAASMCSEDASGDCSGSESYSQVAKKMKEESSDSKSPRPSSSRSQTAATSPLPSFVTLPSFSPVQTSPLAKITLTPALSHRTSSAVKNLRPLLEDETMDARDGYYYGYSRRRVVLGIESIDGEVMEHWGAIGRSCLPLGSSKGGKRKKTRGLKLQLVTHPSYDGSDSDMPSENTSSEEEMDSDYEKDFPPLPLPRISLQQRRDGLSFRKKTSSAPIKKKKKKSSDASPYAVKTKAMRNMHAKKLAAPM